MKRILRFFSLSGVFWAIFFGVPSFATDQCAILATGAASDLAIDDPEKFEYLTRTCRGEGATKKVPHSTSSSNAIVPTQSGEKGKNSAITGPKKNTQLVNHDPTNKASIGCDFLFYPSDESKHPIGTMACVNGKHYECRRLDTGSPSWSTSGLGCHSDDFDIKTKELNLKNLKEVLKQNKDLRE
jgi:hypothetical protein